MCHVSISGLFDLMTSLNMRHIGHSDVALRAGVIFVKLTSSKSVNG